MIVLLFLTLFFLACISFILFAPQLGAKPEGEHLQKIAASQQYRKKQFENSTPVLQKFNLKESFLLLWEVIKGSPRRQPQKKLPSSALVDTHESAKAFLTWFGHSTFLYETAGKKILFDPMLSDYASPLPFIIKRYDYDLPSSVEDLPFLDVVIVSHDHYDHLDYKTVKKLRDKVGMFVVPLGVGAHLMRWGIKKEKITELDWWDHVMCGEIKITAAPSQHFSGRSVNDRQKSLWAAYIIQTKNEKVFFGGDSGYFDGFKEIGEKYGPFDLTLLDSGQYNDLWSAVHMFPEQSVQAHQDLQGKTFMPIHWSAFTLSLHDWTDPVERAVIAAEKSHIEMITPGIGQRFAVLSDKPQEKWWRSV